MQDRIVLSPRGMLFRDEIVHELAQDEGLHRLPKLTINTGTPKYTTTGFHSPKSHRRVHTEVQTARELRKEEPPLYPNYLRRDAKEYPPVHVCKFKVPNYSFRRKEKEITSQLKVVHHTIYNSEKRWIVKNNPSVLNVNSTIYGANKSLAFPINISNTKFDLPQKVLDIEEVNTNDLDASKFAVASVQRDISPTLTRKTLTDSISWTKTRSTNFLHTARTYDPSVTSKSEKLVQMFLKTQREFQNTLMRVEEKAIARMSDFETDRGDVYKFREKLKEAEQTIMNLRAKKKSEDLRYLQRIENLKHTKYSGYKHHIKPKENVEIAEGDPLVIDTIKTSTKTTTERHDGSSDFIHHMHSDSGGKGLIEGSTLKSAVHELSEHSKKLIKS